MEIPCVAKHPTIRHDQNFLRTFLSSLFNFFRRFQRFPSRFFSQPTFARYLLVSVISPAFVAQTSAHIHDFIGHQKGPGLRREIF